MAGGLRRFGAERAIAMYADWTDRIMAGEVPPAPPRPQGRERNVVLTPVGVGAARPATSTTRSRPTSGTRR